MLEKIKNIKSITFKEIMAKYPLVGTVCLSTGALSIFSLIKTVFFWSSGYNSLSIILMIGTAIASFSALSFLAHASNYDGVMKHFKNMNQEEIESVIENLQKAILVYLLGIEKGIFYFFEGGRTDDSSYTKELRHLGAFIYCAKWAENFYLKLNAIKQDNNLASQYFYDLIVEIQGKIGVLNEGKSQNDVWALELEWQNKDKKIILEEIKRSSNYHFKNLEQSILSENSSILPLKNDSLFNSTKQYLTTSL